MPNCPTFTIPLPLQVVVDDVGWWCGEDGHLRGEPFRTGMPRDHVPADYEALASLGRRLGMRPQAATILCEWDRDDLLRRAPTSTWMGEAWTNRRWAGPWLDEAADIVRRNASHFEVCLHGLGHEYWQDGAMSRAEWHDEHGAMRPAADVRRHLDCWFRIQERNHLGAPPESFVPCAFRHCFGRPEGGFAAIAREYGIRFISTPFCSMFVGSLAGQASCLPRGIHEPPACNPLSRFPSSGQASLSPGTGRMPVLLPSAFFGVEAGVMTVDRGRGAVPWNSVAAEPCEEAVRGPVLGLHWPNLLHADPERNEEVVGKWAGFLRGVGLRTDRMLARDTRECWTQLAHWACVEATSTERGLAMDFAHCDRVAPDFLGGDFAIKVQGVPESHPPGPAGFRAAGLRVLSAEQDAAGVRVLRVRRERGALEAAVAVR